MKDQRSSRIMLENNFTSRKIDSTLFIKEQMNTFC